MTTPDQRPGQMRVLVVEDNKDAAEMMRKLLRAFGYQSFVAHDGSAALREVEEGRPDVVLLDIGLPGALDGWEVARRIRGQVHEKMPLIIAVTAYGTDDDRRKSEQAGINLHLTKPADPRQLQSVLREFERGQPPSQAGEI